jgi:DNA-binding NtrC family response regulator
VPTERILVIDDEDGIRRALRTVLERAGYRVREARNGLEALRLWREEAGDLVITDIHMPGMDGLVMIRELHALSPNLPVIAVSGSGEIASRDLLKDAGLGGPIRTLDKPFKINEVLECVREALQSAGRREGGASHSAG